MYWLFDKSAEYVSISCIHPTLTPHCDVISDVINIKSTFWGFIWDVLSISAGKMNLSKIFKNFQNGRHFEARANF